MGQVKGWRGHTIMFPGVGTEDYVPSSRVIRIPAVLGLGNKVPEFFDLGLEDGLLPLGFAVHRVRKGFTRHKGRLDLKGSGQMMSCNRVPICDEVWVQVSTKLLIRVRGRHIRESLFRLNGIKGLYWRYRQGQWRGGRAAGAH